MASWRLTKPTSEESNADVERVMDMDNKETVIGIRKRDGELRLFHAKDAKSATLAQFIRENVSENVDVIITDEWPAYPDAMRRTGMTQKHKTIKHKSHVYVVGDVHTNTVESAFSLLKRGIMGTWHRVSVKHLPAYLDEMCFRFNNRKNPYLFRDTILKLIGLRILNTKISQQKRKRTQHEYAIEYSKRHAILLNTIRLHFHPQEFESRQHLCSAVLQIPLDFSC